MAGLLSEEEVEREWTGEHRLGEDCTGLLRFHHMYVSQLSLSFYSIFVQPYALAIYSYFIVLITLCPDSDYSDTLDPEP